MKKITFQACVVFLAVIVCGTSVYAFPGIINYQGKVDVGENPFTGTGNFKFALVMPGTYFDIYEWSNDGNYPPTTVIPLTVENGLFQVILGFTGGMEEIPWNIFRTSDYLYLRIWFDDGEHGDQVLTPDIRLAVSGYAFTAKNAEVLDGHTYSESWPTTLSTVQAACSNDFHQIGGQDDDSPDSDSEVPDNISIHSTGIYAPATQRWVGMGTTSPQAHLDINGNGSSWQEGFLFIRNTGNDSGIRLYTGTTPEFHIFNSHSDGDKLFITPQTSYGDGIIIKQNGNVGIGSSNPTYDLDVAGRIHASVDYICPSADLAEKLSVHPDYQLESDQIAEKVEEMDVDETVKSDLIAYEEVSQIDPGTVVVITASGIVPCEKKYDTRLAGVVSTRPAVKMASEKKGQYIALAGSVPCKVTGKISAGDVLTTSELPGHAEKAEKIKPCTIVGKALEDFDGQSGVIQVWIGGF